MKTIFAPKFRLSASHIVQQSYSKFSQLFPAPMEAAVERDTDEFSARKIILSPAGGQLDDATSREAQTYMIDDDDIIRGDSAEYFSIFEISDVSEYI